MGMMDNSIQIPRLFARCSSSRSISCPSRPQERDCGQLLRFNSSPSAENNRAGLYRYVPGICQCCKRATTKCSHHYRSLSLWHELIVIVLIECDELNSTAEWNKLGKPQHFLRSNCSNRTYRRKSTLRFKGAMWAFRKSPEQLTEIKNGSCSNVCLLYSPKMKEAYILREELTERPRAVRQDAKETLTSFSTEIFDRLYDPSRELNARFVLGVNECAPVNFPSLTERAAGEIPAYPIEVLNSFLKTIETWLKPIANYFLERLTSSFVEGFNNRVKVLKRRCYGIFDVDHLFQRLTLDIHGYEKFNHT